MGYCITRRCASKATHKQINLAIKTRKKSYKKRGPIRLYKRNVTLQSNRSWLTKNIRLSKRNKSIFKYYNLRSNVALGTGLI